MTSTDGGPLSWVVDAASRGMVKAGLHEVVEGLSHPLPPAGAPVLYCANHVSWWDGFLVRRFHQRHRSGPLFTVMLDEELERHPILRRAGALGLTPGSLPGTRSVLRFLEDLSSAESVVLFPQGRIWPTSRRPLGFQPGLKLFAGALGDPWIVPIGLHLEPMNHARPTAFILSGEPFRWGRGDGGDRVEGAVERVLDRVVAHVGRWGEGAAERPFPGEAERVHTVDDEFKDDDEFKESFGTP